VQLVRFLVLRIHGHTIYFPHYGVHYCAPKNKVVDFIEGRLPYLWHEVVTGLSKGVVYK